MPRPPARVLPAFVLCIAALPAATACTAGLTGQADVPPSAAGNTRPAAPTSPITVPALTDAQAQAALITEADLGAPWAPAQGAATWHDELLKAQTDLPDCQRLLDAVYADELLGTPTGAHAVAGFDDGDDEAQLRYQVLAHRPAEVDRTLAWLRTLPQTCARFTAATTRAGVQNVQVFELALPDVGDARQGLRVTLTGESADGEAATLALDVAVVRVGDDAITLTNGGLGAVSADSTRQAVQLGARRLTEVHHQARGQA
ncbi:hypothetical protein ABZV31_27570 [Streptomyces sp. NPDC005202]|uniref:hypothetical protein n=1 Tax=Streptomyces sp. NPDC005202 TaxID=3157021 RepID=UPI0033A01B7B